MPSIIESFRDSDNDALTVVVRRPEGVLLDGPPWREDYKVGNGHAGPGRSTCQYCEDGRILDMVNIDTNELKIKKKIFDYHY